MATIRERVAISGWFTKSEMLRKKSVNPPMAEIPLVSPGIPSSAERSEDRPRRLRWKEMATRWASEYVLREKTLGSLEAGKWADIVILDKDYLTVPEDEIATIRSVMTIVGGRVIYNGLNP